MAKKYTENKKTDDEEYSKLVEILQKFNSAREYMRKGFLTEWKEDRNLYNSKRVSVNYDGNSDTFLPETFTILQSVKSNVVGGKIKLEFMPTRDDQTGDTRTLNALMDQIWTQDKTKLKASWAIEDSLQTGNGYLWQYWNGEYPCNLYIPTEDNFFDPTATNYENLRWAGYRYLTTKQDLEKETSINPDYDENDEKSTLKIKKYKNIDKIDSYKIGNDKTAKQLREEMVAGSVLTSGEEKENVVEVIVYIDKKRQVKIANRCTIIEDIETPFKRDETTIDSVDDMGNPLPVVLPEIEPFIPVAPARDYVDGAMWYARGEVQVIKDLQELLNDTQNQKTDNLSLSNNMMATLDPSQAHKKDEIQIAPNALFTVPSGTLNFIKPPSIGLDADNEIARLQRMMRAATAADEIVQGMSASGTKTAAEIQSQMLQAGTRFASKLENYENEFFAILANNMFKLLQIFLTKEQAVRMIGQEGVEWKNYNPGEYLGNWDVKVSLEANARAMKEEEKQSAMQFYLMAAKLQFIDQEQLFKYAAEKIFDIDKNTMDRIAPAQQAQAVQQMQMQQMAAETQQAQMNAMPQAGQGELASAPQSNVENAVSAGAQQAQGLNVPGMPTA